MIGTATTREIPNNSAHAELLADHFGEAFASHDAEASNLDLHHDQRDRDQHQGPEHAVAILGADLRVSGDSACIVARRAGNEPRSEECKKRAERAEASPVAWAQRCS